MLRLLDKGLAVISFGAAALVVVLLFAGPSLIGAKKSASAAQSSGSTSQGSGSGTAGQASGAAVFAQAGCGNCHTLKAAGAGGSVGPDLDQVRPDAATVSQIVQSGGGAMPSFSGKLSNTQIAAVASYVSTVAGH